MHTSFFSMLENELEILLSQTKGPTTSTLVM